MHLIYHNVSSSRSGSPADGAFTRPVVAEKIAPALHPQGPPPPGSQAPLLRAPFISYFKTASSNQDIGQRSGPSTCLPGAPVNHGMFEVPSAATPSGCGSSPERFVFCARGRGEDQTGAVTQHLKHENGSFAPPRGALSPSHYPGYHRSASPMGVPGSQWNGDRGLSQRPFLSHPSTPLTRTASPDVLRSQIKRNPGHPDDGLLSQSFPPQVNLSPANHSFSLQQSAFPTLNAGAGIWPLTSAASAARAAAAACNMQGYRACMPMVRQQRLGGADVTQFNALESCAYLSANYSRPASPSVPVTGRTEGSYASAENMRVLSRCVSNLARSGAQTAAAGAKPQQSVLAPGTIPFGSFNDQLHQQQGYSRTPSPVVQQPAQQHAPALQPSGRAGFPAADVFRGADGIRAERSSVASSDRSQNNTGVRDTRPPSPSISQTTYAGYQHDNHPLSHPSDRTLRGGPAGVMNTASSVFLDGHGGGAVSHGAQGTGGHSYGGASQLQPPPTICQSEISPTKTALPLSGVTPPGDRVCAGGKASSASSRRPRSAPPPMLRPQRQIPSLVQQVGNDASGRPFSAGDSESQGESGTRARTVYGGPWQLGETAGASVRSASADPNVISGRHGFAPATTGIAGNGSGRCDPLMTEPTNSCCPCGTVPASVNSCSFTSTSRKLSAFPVAVSAAVAAAAGYSSRTQGQTPGVADCHSGMLTKTRLVLTMKQSAGELGVPRPCQPARMCSTKSLGETEKQPHALPKFGSSLTQTREYSDAARANGSPQSRLPAPVPTTPMLPHVNPRNSHPIHGQGPSQRQESTTLGGQQLHEEGMSWQDKLPSLPPKKAAEQKYGDGASKRHEVEHTYDQGMAPIHSNAISNAGSSESTQSSVERRCSSRRLRSSLSNGELCTADTPGVCSTAGSLPGPGAVAADSSTISAYPASPEPDRQISGSVSFRIRGSSDTVNGEVAADKSALVSSRTRPTPFRAPAKSHPTEIEVQAAVTSGLAQASTDTNENCSDSVQRFETRCHAARDPCDSSSITTDNTSVEEGSDSMTVVRDHPPQPAQGLSVSGGRGDFSLANDVNDDETPQRQVDYRQGSLHSQSDALADSGRSALGGMAGQVQAEYKRERRKDDVGGQVMKDIAPLRNVSGDGQSPSQHETPEHDDIIPLRRFLWEPEKVTWNDQSSFTEKRTKHTSEESLVNCQLDDFELADSRSGGDASLLGRGTYGVVRKLKHKATGEVFAVKSIEKESVVRAGMVSQVEFELLVQKDLLRHRNVLRCFACVEDAEHVHLILEYCSRGDLYTKVRSQTRRRLSEREAFVYFSQLVNGLHYLHGKGVMHRDLKLENLLLDSNNVLKIADLGWCGSVLGKTKNFNFCGTLDYLAPEMVRGGGHDWRVDLWGAGILLYEMLDGKPPFQSTRHLELVQQVLKAEVTIPPHISPDAGDLILQLLRYEPESRIPLHALPQHPWVKRMWSELRAEYYAKYPKAVPQRSGRIQESTGTVGTTQRLTRTSSVPHCEKSPILDSRPLVSRRPVLARACSQTVATGAGGKGFACPGAAAVAASSDDGQRSTASFVASSQSSGEHLLGAGDASRSRGGADLSSDRIEDSLPAQPPASPAGISRECVLKGALDTREGESQKGSHELTQNRTDVCAPDTSKAEVPGLRDFCSLCGGEASVSGPSRGNYSRKGTSDPENAAVESGRAPVAGSAHKGALTTEERGSRLQCKSRGGAGSETVTSSVLKSEKDASLRVLDATDNEEARLRQGRGSPCLTLRSIVSGTQVASPAPGDVDDDAAASLPPKRQKKVVTSRTRGRASTTSPPGGRGLRGCGSLRLSRSSFQIPESRASIIQPLEKRDSVSQVHRGPGSSGASSHLARTTETASSKRSRRTTSVERVPPTGQRMNIQQDETVNASRHNRNSRGGDRMTGIMTTERRLARGGPKTTDSLLIEESFSISDEGHSEKVARPLRDSSELSNCARQLSETHLTGSDYGIGSIDGSSFKQDPRWQGSSTTIKSHQSTGRNHSHTMVAPSPDGGPRFASERHSQQARQQWGNAIPCAMSYASQAPSLHPQMPMTSEPHCLNAQQIGDSSNVKSFPCGRSEQGSTPQRNAFALPRPGQEGTQRSHCSRYGGADPCASRPISHIRDPLRAADSKENLSENAATGAMSADGAMQTSLKAHGTPSTFGERFHSSASHNHRYSEVHRGFPPPVLSEAPHPLDEETNDLAAFADHLSEGSKTDEILVSTVYCEDSEPLAPRSRDAAPTCAARQRVPRSESTANRQSSRNGLPKPRSRSEHPARSGGKGGLCSNQAASHASASATVPSQNPRSVDLRASKHAVPDIGRTRTPGTAGTQLSKAGDSSPSKRGVSCGARPGGISSLKNNVTNGGGTRRGAEVASGSKPANLAAHRPTSRLTTAEAGAGARWLSRTPASEGSITEQNELPAVTSDGNSQAHPSMGGSENPYSNSTGCSQPGWTSGKIEDSSPTLNSTILTNFGNGIDSSGQGASFGGQGGPETAGVVPPPSPHQQQTYPDQGGATGLAYPYLCGNAKPGAYAGTLPDRNPATCERRPVSRNGFARARLQSPPPAAASGTSERRPWSTPPSVVTHSSGTRRWYRLPTWVGNIPRDSPDDSVLRLTPGVPGSRFEDFLGVPVYSDPRSCFQTSRSGGAAISQAPVAQGPYNTRRHPVLPTPSNCNTAAFSPALNGSNASIGLQLPQSGMTATLHHPPHVQPLQRTPSPVQGASMSQAGWPAESYGNGRSVLPFPGSSSSQCAPMVFHTPSMRPFHHSFVNSQKLFASSAIHRVAAMAAAVASGSTGAAAYVPGTTLQPSWGAFSRTVQGAKGP